MGEFRGGTYLSCFANGLSSSSSSLSWDACK